MSVKNWKRYYVVVFNDGEQTRPYRNYYEARSVVQQYQKQRHDDYRVMGILAVRGRTNACFNVQQQLAECSI